VYVLCKRRGVYMSRSPEWNVKRTRTTHVPEERANRSKGIRGAEDGQSGSGTSSPRDSGREEECESEEGKGRNSRRETAEGRRETPQCGSRRQVAGMWKEEERRIYCILARISSSDDTRGSG